ncbi:cellulose-binding protein [Streptacidiphilus sp. PB12-B1b]|uniref:cellulose binding domain-containing protein n=1 Tax=Streptacidiphilus sp. PB12-B1b TaxID=2705012 RepID=UPI0015F8F452|nr:cellulose binding domain-containing protein [Streptacidiphilus sp. PB12-B1b]QMU78425.1 cellulose-binding protein [Streptacidiphilus sp. PB12-B1b]
MHRRSRRRFLVATTAPAVLALTVGGFLLAQGAKASSTIAVEVNAASSLGTVPSTANGINTGVFDGQLNDSATTSALKSAGVDALRYPGGSTSDAYNWQTNSVVSGQGYANPSNDFDDFMGIADKVGASPVITVNYGSGTAAEAAAWVKYADVTKNYGVKYWELGNEVYGDGTYGSSWEYNTKSKGATAYADNIEDYITRMKAADSSIKVGAVLTTDGDWPDGLVAGSYGDTADWNETVLKTDGSKLDFVILHDYPDSTTEAGMLAQYQNIATIIKKTRSEIDEYAGSNAANIKIMVTETNSGYEVDSVPAALYAADTYMTFLQNGVANIDWWDLHNGAGTISTDADGTTDYGDSAILSSGNCTGSTCEPAKDTAFPMYYGIQAVGDFAPAGADMIATTSSNSAVTAYATRRTDGGLNVMLVNHSATTSEPVSLAYNGFSPSGVTSAEQFSPSTKKLTSVTGTNTRALTLPAYSITVLKLSGSTPASGSPSASASPSPSTASCKVTTTKTYDWGNGYTENVTIRNTGSAAVSAWKLAFAVPGNEKITYGWSATYHQSGKAVIAHPVSYDGTITAGTSVTIGYTASYTGTDTAPTWYTLNGVHCG